MDVLHKYKIEFHIRSINGKEVITVDSPIVQLLGEFFWQNEVPKDIDEMIDEMTKAMNNQAFDPIWESVADDEFHIGPVTTTFNYFSGDYPDFEIPTSDLKDIFIAFRDWVVDNNFRGCVGGMVSITGVKH